MNSTVHPSSDTPSALPDATPDRPLRLVAGLWRRHWRLFQGGLVLTLMATGFELCLPLAAARLVASILAPDSATGAVWYSWSLLVGAFAGAALLRNAGFRLLLVVAARNMAFIADATHAAVQRLGPEWHAAQPAGATMRRLSQGMWGYDSATDAIGLRLAPAFVILVGLCGLIAWRLPIAGAWAVAVLVLFLLLNAWAGRRYLRPANRESSALDAQLNAELGDALWGHATVRAFAAESYESARMATATARWRDAITCTWRRFVDVGLAQNALLWLLLVGVTGAAIRAWSHGQAHAGDVAFAITAFLQMAAYLRNVGDDVRSMQKGLDQVAAVAEIIHAPPAPTDARTLLAKAPVPMSVDHITSGEIAFEDVSFSYGRGRGALYTSLDLRVRAGETILIVGPSGSGKSSLVKLLQRQYTPQQGRILVGGIDVASLPQDQLRRSIAAASQDTGLLHRSIHDNIAYARPDASRDEVIDAAQMAGAHDFIVALPDGYETLVGEPAKCLSGGQVQRIALARALLSRAPILVLDEATSALDDATERGILARLAGRAGTQTRIVISHRPSPLLGADRVFELAGGRLRQIKPPPPIQAVPGRRRSGGSELDANRSASVLRKSISARSFAGTRRRSG